MHRSIVLFAPIETSGASKIIRIQEGVARTHSLEITERGPRSPIHPTRGDVLSNGLDHHIRRITAERYLSSNSCNSPPLAEMMLAVWEYLRRPQKPLFRNPSGRFRHESGCRADDFAER